MLISQTLRPLDTVRFNTENYALAPIAGLQMLEQSVRIGDLILLRCNRAEWETVERGYVFKDWHAEYYRANPVFLYRPFAEAPDPATIQQIFAQLAQDTARLISACRLYKTGSLLEPVYTARFVARGATIAREVGPYRTEYLAMPIDGMVWPLEASERQDVEALHANLQVIERIEGAAALRAVLDQFNLSHTPAVSNFFAVHMLFTALEMLFDPLPKRIDARTTAYDRALALLRWWQGDALDPAFEDFYLNHVRGVRNAVHHHALRDSGVDLAEVRFRLRIAIMMGIRMLMRLYCAAAAGDGTDLNPSPEWSGLPPKDLMNACLDRLARGDPAPLRALVGERGQFSG